eukprot:403338366
MFCFERQEFFCAKCDFKGHNQRHVKCEGEVNKDILDIKETAIKLATTFNADILKFKQRTRVLFDYKENAMKLHVIEAFMRLAIFHFSCLGHIKSESNNIAQNETDFQFLNLLIGSPKNFIEIINNLFKAKNVKELWKLYKKVIVQYVELLKFANLFVDELLAVNQKNRQETIQAICHKIVEEKYLFTCEVNSIIYQSELSEIGWIRIFNTYFHYIYLQDTYLFFPQQTQTIQLNDQQKIEFVSLQVLQNDHQLPLSEMYQFRDKEQDNLKMLRQVQEDIKLVSQDKRSIKPYFLEAFSQVSLQYFEEFREIQSKFSDTCQIYNPKLAFLEFSADLAQRLQVCIEMELIQSSKETQGTIATQIAYLQKMHKYCNELLCIEDPAELQQYVQEKSLKIEQKYLHDQLFKILEDEDYLEEKSGIDNICQLQMQDNQKKLFLQIVYEIRKGETSWYEGQWSNTLGQQIGNGLLLMIDTQNLLEKRELFIGEFKEVYDIQHEILPTQTLVTEQPLYTEDRDFYDEDQDHPVPTETQDRGPDDVTINGEGMYIWSDGTLYNGEWISNLRQGQGEYFWPEGSSYKGNWKNDIWMGEGQYTNSYGVQFKGNWHSHQLLPGNIEVQSEKHFKEKIMIKQVMTIQELDQFDDVKEIVAHFQEPKLNEEDYYEELNEQLLQEEDTLSQGFPSNK